MEIANSMRPPFAHPLTSLLLLTNVLSKKLVLSPAGLRGSKLRESREVQINAKHTLAKL